MPNLPAVENPNIPYSWPSKFEFLCICGSASGDSTDRGRCSTAVVTMETIPRISGPAQFIPMLFKSQLYRVSVLQDEKVQEIHCTTE